MSDIELHDDELKRVLMEIGGNVKTFRAEVLNVSVEKFAELADLSSRTIMRIESGNGNVSMKSFCKIMILMGNGIGFIESSKPSGESLSGILSTTESAMKSNVSWENE